MIWSAKCLYPKARNLDNMAGRFMETLLAENSNFLGVRNTVQCCHVLDQMDHFSGLLNLHVLIFKRRSVISCTPWPISNLSLCLSSYDHIEPHYFILSLIIFGGGFS